MILLMTVYYDNVLLCIDWGGDFPLIVLLNFMVLQVYYWKVLVRNYRNAVNPVKILGSDQRLLPRGVPECYNTCLNEFCRLFISVGILEEFLLLKNEIIYGGSYVCVGRERNLRKHIIACCSELPSSSAVWVTMISFVQNISELFQIMVFYQESAKKFN